MNTAEKKSTSLRLEKELYNVIVKIAKKQNRSVNNFIETTLAEVLHYKEPNRETKEAIEEARTSLGNAKGYKNTDELFKELAK